MLVIRFNRTGRKNNPQYRLVVQEKEIAPGGRHVEVVGSYNPHRKTSELKAERIQYWIEQGAQPSDTVYNLLVSESIVKGEKRAVKVKEKVKEEGESEEKKEASEEVAKEEGAKKEDASAVKEEKKEEPKPEPKKEEAKDEPKKEEKKGKDESPKETTVKEEDPKTEKTEEKK